MSFGLISLILEALVVGIQEETPLHNASVLCLKGSHPVSCHFLNEYYHIISKKILPAPNF